MKYICLRDCFVDSRFWHEGRTYDLPDDMQKTLKNFKLVNEPESPMEKPAFTCPVCRKVLTAKIALAGHMRSHK